jgi:hypothetical protein
MRGSIGGIILFFWIVSAGAYAFAEGEVSSLKEFEYWDNGKIRQCTMYDTKGHLKAKAFCRYDGTVEKVERFDFDGNKIEEVFYDGKGRLRIGLDGWAAMRWWYEDSHLKSQVSYDELGKPVERKQYSDSGRLIWRQYKEALDDLVPYEAASMATMLGGRNVRYFGASTKVNDGVPAIKE